MKNKINFLGRTTKWFLCIAVALFLNSCEDAFKFDLPDANSIDDTILPEANFSYASVLEDYKTIKFTNLSTEATTFAWDFGGGNTSTEQDPTFTFDAGEGTYPVTLTASDARGASGSITIDVMVVEGPFQPIIIEPGFEDNTLPDGTGDGRDSWRADWTDERAIFGISSNPVTFGSQAAKLEASNARQGYQEITVEPNTNYDLGFWYTMVSGSSDPWAIVAIVGVTEFGPIGSIADAEAGIIASITVTDDSDPSTYVQQKLSFNSGVNNTVGIYFWNDANVEVRLDDFTIEIGVAGAVPPSPGFSSAQSQTNYLEYTFSNTSANAVSYEWNFGDGNTSTEESPTHVYATPDVYTVTLTATSAEGKTASLSKTIDIQAPVTAAFTFEVDQVDYKTYHFMDASVDAVMLLWEFGDGYQFTGMNPSHTYDEDGVYTVTLTAYSLTGKMDQETAQLTVALGFIVQVLNGTFDEYTNTTGDNADAWDMTPPSTVIDNNGNEIPSPYQPLWNNTDLNAYIDATYCTNEQPATTSDGTNGTRGAKFSESCRRLYQVVQVEQGAEYTFSIDTRSEAMGVNTEVFILNTEITSETGINASTSDPAIDAYFEITNDFNTDKTIFTTSTFTFTASANQIVIYVRSLGAIDGSNEVFLDNVTIVE